MMRPAAMGPFGLSESTRERNGKTVHIVSVAGELDAHTFRHLQEKLEALIAERERAVVIDFGKLDYISSAGLQVLKRMVHETRSGGGDIRLSGLSQKIHNIVNVLGFQRIFQIFASADEAVQSY
jgi:anti-anti-sigma factor